MILIFSRSCIKKVKLVTNPYLLHSLCIKLKFCSDLYFDLYPQQESDRGRKQYKNFNISRVKRAFPVKQKAFFLFWKGPFFDQVKLINLKVSYITFIKSLKRKIQMHQNTVKTQYLINLLTRKSNTNSGPHKSFEIKNTRKGENSENSSPHQNFERKSKTSAPHQSFEKKKNGNAKEN